MEERSRIAMREQRRARLVEVPAAFGGQSKLAPLQPREPAVEKAPHDPLPARAPPPEAPGHLGRGVRARRLVLLLQVKEEELLLEPEPEPPSRQGAGEEAVGRREEERGGEHGPREGGHAP